MSGQKDMYLVNHLTELRKRVILIMLVFILTLIGGLIVAEPVIIYLKSKPPLAQMEWNAFSPWDAIKIYMMFAFIISLSISLPFILYQIWLFMKPALHDRERKAAYRYIPWTTVLFVTGFSFAYFIIFPMAVKFSTFFTNKLQLVETFGVVQYFNFMFNIIFPITIIFQMPVFIMFLTEVRILNPKLLIKMRRFAYLMLVILSTLVTPPDFISAILVAMPLIFLYECSVYLAKYIKRKQHQ